ncbi:MAG: ATP-binding protein, partial [Sphaerospermopsis kisseleviana]
EPENFFGRDDLFGFITDNLERGQKVIVLSGQRRIGKTSILKQIPQQVSQLIKDDKYYFVDLDLQDKNFLTLDEFLYELSEQIIQSSEIGSSLQIPAIEDFKKNANQLFFGKILPQIYKHLDNKSIVLLLDEFDVFAHGKEFLKLLKNHNENKDKLFCIPVLGSNLDNISNSLDLSKSPHKKIGLLDKDDAIELITKPAQSILEYTQGAREKIWKLTSGHPYFTQVICHAIFTQARKNSQFHITNDDVEKAINTALELSEFGLTALWKSLQIPENVVFAIVAFFTEENNLELDSSRIINELNKYGVDISKSDLEKSRENLVEWNFLEELDNSDKNRVTITIKLFSQWLIKKYSLKEIIYQLEQSVPEANELFIKTNEQENEIDTSQNHDENHNEHIINLYEQVLNLNPNYFTALYKLGELCLTCQEFIKAIDYYERYYKINYDRPKDDLIDARLKYGEYLMGKNNFYQAKEQFESILFIDKENEIATENLKRAEEEIEKNSTHPYAIEEYARPYWFVGRSYQFDRAFEQIQSCSSAVFYGFHGVGKTSFLRYLASPQHWDERYKYVLLKNSKKYILIYVNCDLIENLTFSEFWREILNKEEVNSLEELNTVLQQDTINKHDVKKILEKIKDKRQVLVLLIDNYDVAFNHHKEDESKILRFIREFSSLTNDAPNGSLSTIMTSSKNIEFVMESISNYLPNLWLPLKPFKNTEISNLWNRMPDLWNKREDLRNIVQETTGGYPVLVQMLCFSLYNNLKNLVGQNPTKEILQEVEREFNQLAEKILRNIWQSLDDEKKILLGLIALYHVQGKISTTNYDISDVETVLTNVKHKSNLEGLEANGIILIERSQKKVSYKFASSSMQEWVVRAISKNQVPEINDREKIALIMTKKQINKIHNAIKWMGENEGTVQSVAGGISGILRLFGL